MSREDITGKLVKVLDKYIDFIRQREEIVQAGHGKELVFTQADYSIAFVEKFILPEIERLLADEREKVRELCCRPMCPHCAAGETVTNVKDDYYPWVHLGVANEKGPRCMADEIRQLDLTQDLAASSAEER